MQGFLERFPIATLIIGVIVVTGCIDVVIDGDLSEGFGELLRALDIPLAGLAVGRGIMARKSPR